MQISPLNLFFFCSALTGFLAVFMLIFGGLHKSFPRLLLAGSIFCLAYVLLHLTFVHTGWILSIPHFYRTASPLSYLIAPFSYLYVRTTIQSESRLQPYDWVLFLPGLFHFMELSPFYLTGTEEKTAYLNELMEHLELKAQINEGFLPSYWHQIVKGGLGIIYLGFQWKLLLPYLTGKKKDKPRYLISWLVYLTTIFTLLALTVLISGAIHDFGFDTQTVMTFGISGLFLGLLLILFIRPRILYGISDPHPQSKPSSVTKSSSKNNQLTPEKLLEIQHRIEKYIEDETPYLQKGFSLTVMAREIEIPRHRLSIYINEIYQMRFSDWVNRLRVEYACNKVDPLLWEALSIDGLAEEAGFNSRHTFSRVFKKIKKTSPSSYRKVILQNADLQEP